MVRGLLDKMDARPAYNQYMSKWLVEVVRESMPGIPRPKQSHKYQTFEIFRMMKKPRAPATYEY